MLNFIVLGEIPGTSMQLTFYGVLLLFIGFVSLAYCVRYIYIRLTHKLDEESQDFFQLISL